MKMIPTEKILDIQESILNTATNKSLTHIQRVFGLAGLADSLIDVLDLPEGYLELKNENIICDLFEGNAPIRPRYIVPDYKVLFEKGCKFLRLDPPTDLYESLNSLLILYKNVPSVTNYPVYIGDLDVLLEPFVSKMNYEEAKKALKLFFIHIDRTIPDAFCHANIGPNDTITGRIILEIERELQDAVPNLTIKYDTEFTPDSFALEAIKTQMVVAKPAFANNKMFSKEFNGNYAIASCYNGLHIGGGSHTLVRILLGNLADTAKNSKDFFENVLPNAIDIMLKAMDERIRFICEDSNFFEYNFLSTEGFIDINKFSAMLGIVGLGECVNTLMSKDKIEGRYGNSKIADDLGVKIIKAIDDINNNHTNIYCKGTNDRFLLHGQVGIDTDKGQTPNCRIPIGEEPAELADHLDHCAKFHKYFPSGIGEIFLVDSTVLKNPEYLLDIIKSSFNEEVRHVCFHDSNSDVIRVTGYLAKRSDMEKLEQGEAVLVQTTSFGLGAKNNSKVRDRKRR